MAKLPYELLLTVFELLAPSPRDLLECSRVCKAWRAPALDNATWQKACWAFSRRWHPGHPGPDAAKDCMALLRDRCVRRRALAAEFSELGEPAKIKEMRDRALAPASGLLADPDLLDVIARFQAAAPADRQLTAQFHTESLRRAARCHWLHEELAGAATLEDGALAIAQVLDPTVSSVQVRAELDALAATVRSLSDMDPADALDMVFFEEFHGDTETYYDLRNSNLAMCIRRRRGIPITLCAIYEALARRVDPSLEFRPVNAPAHFVLMDMRRSEQEGSPMFVDPFSAERYGVSGFFDRVSVVRNATTEAALSPVATVRPVFLRMIRNIANVAVRAGVSDETSGQILPLVLELAREAHAGPQTFTSLALELSFIGGDLFPLRAAADAFRNSGIVRRDLAKDEVDDDASVMHADQELPAFTVGTVYRHKLWGYRAVVIAWDPFCDSTPEWIEHNGVNQLPNGPDQPFYHCLVDSRDRRSNGDTYVAEENILPIRLEAGERVHNFKIGRYFDRLEQGRYVPNTALRNRYPRG